MRIKHLYICILGIILIGAAAYICVKWFKEGFQVSNCSIPIAEAAAAATRFSNIVDAKDTPDMSQKLLRVSSPDPSDPNDKLPVKFSNYISMYALARRQATTDLSGARADLFTCYNTLQSEMQTNLYSQITRAAWDTSPIAETCKKLDTLRASYIVRYANLNKQVQDLSGTEITAEKMRDENLAYQNTLTDKCKVTPMSPACRSLASQEGPVYELLSKYTNVNISVFSDAVDISENLLTINQTYKVMGCKYPNQFFSTAIGAPVFWVDNNVKYAVSTCAACSAEINAKCMAANIAPQSFLDSCSTSSTPFSCSMVKEAPSLEIIDSQLPLIDTESLRMKLQNMSPYFLSPDIVDFITSSTTSDAAAKLQTTPEILANLTAVIGNIKKYTNTP
jgi:hypothetical protein